jgi:hypothetical protein
MHLAAFVFGAERHAMQPGDNDAAIAACTATASDRA